MIRVEGHSNLYRDEKTGAIINMDNVGYQNYLNSSKNARKEKEELNNMKKDIEDIKDVLKEILGRLT
tara:strand:+ start:174 stop:374 length:201 start_codon:yes stop_codon:yes gene_type:complete